jgi:hypothetical protein
LLSPAKVFLHLPGQAFAQPSVRAKDYHGKVQVSRKAGKQQQFSI